MNGKEMRCRATALARMLQSEFVVIAAVTFSCVLSSHGVDSAKVILTNDGPAVIGTPITFYAKLDRALDNYIYEFQDAVNYSMRQEVSGFDKAQAQFIYRDVPEGKTYKMVVRVYFTIFGNKAWIISKDESVFSLSSNLIGQLKIEQDDVKPDVLGRGIVAANRNANISYDMYDPSDFFSKFNISYVWTVEGLTFPNLSSVLNYDFAAAKLYQISVIVTAKSSSPNMTLFGHVNQSITAKDTISDLKVDGKTWITRDKNLELAVTCASGSPAFSFCKEIFFDNETASKNFTCSPPHSLSEKCNYHVSWYFRNSGSYYLVMQVANDVTTFTKKYEINVVDVTKQAQLSFVIIPVASSILAILIIMVGIAYHLQQRQRYTVEVADFDFQQRELLNEKTFFERVRDSFSASFKAPLSASRLISSRGTSYDNFIDDVDSPDPEFGEPRLSINA